MADDGYQQEEAAVICEHCGREVGNEHIPPDISALAQRAGFKRPVWYAGPLLCPELHRLDGRVGTARIAPTGSSPREGT